MIMQKFQQFMYGRNGVDMLGFACFIGGFVLNIVFVLSGWKVFYILSLAAYAYALFRGLSKNVTKRRAENQKFLSIWWRVKNKFIGLKADFEQRRIYKYFKCPNCGQKIRIPRGRGRVEICCPKCQNKFIKKV